MRDLFSKAATGLKWTSFSSLGVSLSQFTLGILLARLLSPEEFGLVAMVTVIIGYASILVDFGLSSVLVQRPDVSEEEYSGVFWINMMISTSIALLMVIFAERIALFYQREVLVTITYCLAPILMINALGLCYRSRLEREIDLRLISLSEMVSVVLSSIMAITLAITGYGVWSLVIMYLARAILYNGIIIMFSDWRPLLKFKLKSLSPLVGFSSALLTNRMAEGAAASVDRVLVGKVSGSVDLGIYEKAKNLMLMPTMMVAGVISRVALPSLSRIQQDDQRFSRGYIKMMSLVSFVVFPMVFGMHVIAKDIIPFVFGVQWADMVPVFRILCWAGLFTVANILTDNVIVSSGNQKGLLKLTFIEKPFMVALFFFGIIWGVIGMAVAYLVGSVLTFLFKTYVATGPLGITSFDLYRIMFRPLMGSFLMYAVVFLLMQEALFNAPVYLRLLISVGTGILIYYLTATMFQRVNLNYLNSILREFGK